ncbi:PREDICTED: semaphorin-2A-like [Priapulus caudatus]|uniref:Semaphorin-2A-like n=1 Tax=Priapulus caudatus TaxID=37621 RepID=A0ABM1E6L3_PRICU|nr:PREDICTED: semaphorin-2A-like [Priapulus caudatus]
MGTVDNLRRGLLLFLAASFSTPEAVAEIVFMYSPDHVKNFSIGHHFYRTMTLDEESHTLYVGSMNFIHRLNLFDISNTGLKFAEAEMKPTYLGANSQYLDDLCTHEPHKCENHIRVILKTASDKLYVCGTNSFSPKDWLYDVDLRTRDIYPPYGDGIAKCPFDPENTLTAVWVETGNPEDIASVYSGTMAHFRADPILYRPDLNIHGYRIYSYLRTLKADTKWLNEPWFVGSFDIDEHVYFFFREVALEHMNCGKTVFSRVARVCKNDKGGRNVLRENWTTYLKARLNCSIPGEFPFSFDEIRDVFQLPGDTSKFYAVFTTPSNGLMGSAICVFNEKDIESAFQGAFKEQASPTSTWLPVSNRLVPQPRPGQEHAPERM